MYVDKNPTNFCLTSKDQDLIFEKAEVFPITC
jgi:hypothetical protein